MIAFHAMALSGHYSPLRERSAFKPGHAYFLYNRFVRWAAKAVWAGLDRSSPWSHLLLVGARGATNERKGAMTLVALVIGLGLFALFLLIAYGLVMIVFRFAFGINLPNPFDYLPSLFDGWKFKARPADEARIS